MSRNYNKHQRSRRGSGNLKSNRRQRNLNPQSFVQKAVPVEQRLYVSQHKFVDFAFSDQLHHNIKDKGYTTPTPIQDQSIKPILEGRDVIGIANTGTGKTAAFLLPLIQKICDNPTQRVMIIAPTRELAVQIHQELRDFAKHLKITSTICIGGVSIKPQIYDLYRNPKFVVGTPGRLKDLEMQRSINFSNYQNIVLDEVDRMLDMGFVRDIRYIISKLASKRQSLFFSATLPTEAREISQELLNNPVLITVEQPHSSKNVEQDILKVTRGESKIELLHDLLIQETYQKVLVFGKTKWGVEKLSSTLQARGFKTASIHGNKSQSQRQTAIQSFKLNKIQVLLATDVASRGLDIPDITHVINYDPPQTYEDYIHRIGRTGRSNKTGYAITFVEN